MSKESKMRFGFLYSLLLTLYTFALRRGLLTSSPPQFGQICFNSSTHFSQKVHSNVQMKAVPCGVRRARHFSHRSFIRSAMVKPLNSAALRRTAAVVRHRRDVADGANFNAGSSEGADGALTAGAGA